MPFGLLALVLQGAPAQPPVDVRWVGSPACIDERDLVTQVVELAGPPASPIELEATSVAQGWQVTVRYDDTVRVVEAADCAVLTEAVALIVAVRVDAIATASSVEPKREPAPEPLPDPPPGPPPPPDPVPAPAPAVEPEPEPPAPPRKQAAPVRATALLGVGGDLGTLPRGGVALRADVGMRWRALEVDLGGLATLGPPSPPRRGVESAFRLFGGLAQACWVLESGAVAAPLCARTEVGVLQASPRGLSSPRDVNALWVAPGVRAGLAPRRWRFAPEGFVEVAAPLQQHSFEVGDTGVGELHRLPPVVVRLGLALRWKGRG